MNMLRFEPAEHDKKYVRIWRDDRLTGHIHLSRFDGDPACVIFETKGPFTLLDLHEISTKVTELVRDDELNRAEEGT
jgi:hypothetical protein